MKAARIAFEHSEPVLDRYGRRKRTAALIESQRNTSGIDKEVTD